MQEADPVTGHWRSLPQTRAADNTVFFFFLRELIGPDPLASYEMSHFEEAGHSEFISYWTIIQIVK